MRPCSDWSTYHPALLAVTQIFVTPVEKLGLILFKYDLGYCLTQKYIKYSLIHLVATVLSAGKLTNFRGIDSVSLLEFSFGPQYLASGWATFTFCTSNFAFFHDYH